jgi:hypothetical protein
MAVFLKPEAYTQRTRSLDAGSEPDQDPGNPTVPFRGDRRATQTHVSTTDPEATLANNGQGTAAMVGSTGNGRRENRHRLLGGIKVESCRGPASETDGGRCGICSMRSLPASFRPWARKKIEELWGAAKCWQSFRRFQRRERRQVRDEAYRMGWLLKLNGWRNYSRPQPRGTRKLGGVQG